MSFRSGIDAQFGIAQETTWATLATPTRFYEFDSESVKNTINFIKSKGLRASTFIQRTDRWANGTVSVGGDITMEVENKGYGIWFKNMLGSVATAGSTAYTHTCTPGDLHGLGLTAQFGRPDLAGTVQPFTYTGCKITSWELSNAINDLLNLKVTLDGVAETTSTSLAAVSYPSTTEKFYFTEGSLTVGGTAHDVINWSLAGTNNVKNDRYYISGTTPAQKREQERNGTLDLTGSLQVDFSGLTDYNRFINGTLASLVLTYNTVDFITGSTPYSVVITVPNAHFTGDTPNVAGMDILSLNLPFEAYYDGTNPAVTIAYTTSDATP